MRALHHDVHGTISILSVIVLLMLTMLLGMIMNVGEQIDDKIKMQNAADAATYSSGVVLSRGLNTLAFTNHLLSETFALTAYFREGRDRFAESLVPEILDRWKVVSEQLGLSEFQKIRDIQPAVEPRIQMEREVVTAFGDMTYIKARMLLPALEAILGIPEVPPGTATSQDLEDAAQSHLIPVFQRAVVLAIGSSSNLVCNEIAKRNTPGKKNSSTKCVMYTQVAQTSMTNDRNPMERLLPAVEPSFEGQDATYLSPEMVRLYQDVARERRDDLAGNYLSQWINDDNFDLGPFERETLSTGGRVYAKMSRFIQLYRGFTCAKLNQLLQLEFPNTNLPHVLRQPFARTGQLGAEPYPLTTQQKYLEEDFTFYGVVYRRQRDPVMPGMYRIPMRGDAVAFAAVSLYLPLRRYDTMSGCPPYRGLYVSGWDGSSGCGPNHRDGWPPSWSLFSQNWAARLVPTSSANALEIVRKQPNPILAPDVTMPNFSKLELQDLKAINFH